MHRELLKLVRNRSIVSLFSVALLLFAACGAAQAPAQDEPEELLKKGEYTAAITTFKRLLTANPGDEDARRLLLRAYFETGKYKEAETLASASAAPPARLVLADPGI